MFLGWIWPVPLQVQAVRSPSGHARREAKRGRQDALLDEALEGTFPASDPISISHIR